MSGTDRKIMILDQSYGDQTGWRVCAVGDPSCLSWEGMQEDFSEEAALVPGPIRSGEVRSSWLVGGTYIPGLEPYNCSE